MLHLKSFKPSLIPIVNSRFKFGHSTVKHSSKVNPTSSKYSDRQLRPFDSIPSVSHSIPFFSSILKLAFNGGAGHLHEYCDRNFRRLGPIYRERLGTVDGVYISDADLIQQVFSQEDSTPGHFLPEPWLLYNQSFRQKRGLLFL